MNICEFANGINTTDAAFMIKQYFDEIMILYELIGNRQDIDICTGNNDIAEFILTMNTKKDAKKLYNSLNNTVFSVYNDTFSISMILNDQSITTTITKQQ